MSVLPPPSTPLTPLPPATTWPSPHWETAPAPTGLAADVSSGFTDPALGETLAVVVVHGGKIVAESYGPGIDASTTLTSWSMAKSITHAFIGILVRDGRLSISDRTNLVEWADDERAEITIDQLLRMTSGLTFIEDYVDASVSHCIEMLFGSGAGDTASYAAALPLAAPPDTVFSYSSGTTNILSRVMASVVGDEQAQQAWMHQELFGPIGMSTAKPRFDAAGTFIGSSFLYASARDFARFGLLYLRGGRWRDRQLLTQEWVDQARTARGVDEGGNLYGSHWWVHNDERGSFRASGFEGQRVVVVPQNDLVVVRLGKTPATQDQELSAWINTIITHFDAG